jgi:hypothetical protein
MFVVFDDDQLSPRRGEMFVARAADRLSPEGKMSRPLELLARTFDTSGVGAVRDRLLQTLSPSGVREH